MTDIQTVDANATDSSSAQETSHKKSAAQFIGPYRVPYNYEVWGDGIYQVEPGSSPDDDTTTPDINSSPSSSRRQDLKIVCHEPIWIKRFGRALDTGEQLVELAYRDALSHNIESQWVNRLQLASKQKLVALSREGLPVNDGNVTALMYYLDHALHINGPRLECVLVAGRSGAYQLEYVKTLERDPDGTPVKTETCHNFGWLVGDRWIGPSNTRVVSDPREMHTMTRGFQTSGQEEEWRKKWQEVTAAGPVVRWLCHSTFAPPVLRFIKQRTFIVHHFGATGAGKSSLLKFGLAAWGDPQLLMANFNRTEKSFVELFRHVDDLPVGFDELQSSMAKDHAQIIYALCLERGRARAMKDGGLQREIESWRTVVRMTGEEPIIGKGGFVDLGGQANRVVQIGVPLLTSQQAGNLHQWMEDRHYGWGGLRFLEKLEQAMEFPDGPRLLQEKFNSIYRSVLAACPDTVHSAATNLSCVALAQYLAQRFLFNADAEAATQQAIDDAVTVAKSIAGEEIRESLVEQALQVFQDHFLSHRSYWYDMSIPEQRNLIEEGQQRQLTGVLVPDEAWLVQKEANLLLLKAGLPPRRVWPDLKRAGLLFSYDSPKNHTFACVRKAHKFLAKVYILKRGKLVFPRETDKLEDESSAAGLSASPSPSPSPSSK